MDEWMNEWVNEQMNEWLSETQVRHRHHQGSNKGSFDCNANEEETIRNCCQWAEFVFEQHAIMVFVVAAACVVIIIFIFV